MNFRARLRHVVAAAVLALTIAGPAWSFPDPKEMLTDFIHYGLTANVQLALENGQKLLDSGISNADLTKLLEETNETERFERAIARTQLVKELEGVSAELAKRVEGGRRDMSRDPKRIAEAVTMLGGVQRAKLLGTQRLLAAKEYAAPALLKEITEGRDEQVKLACQDILVKMGAPAVNPLCEALMGLSGPSQQIVCNILAMIGHPEAGPYLRELALDSKADGPSREAAQRALNGLGVTEPSVSVLYAKLARQYFDGAESLVAFPGEDMNNVWNYSTITGLSPTPVPTGIYTEVMAMRTAAKAVHADGNNAAAVSLYVAADLKRENDMPDGATDPVYGNEQYTPEFFATVFGTQTCLDVLALAIDKVDTPLVRDAIEALSKTTGGANLFARGNGRQALLEALTYPDRRVQYEAALTLGRALPQKKFSGDDAVVPILASAVRMSNKSLAIVIADNPENLKNSASMLSKFGFEIVGQGASVAEVGPDLIKAVGVDLAYIRMANADNAKKALGELRSVPKAAAAPVVLAVSAIDNAKLRTEFRGDHRVNPVTVTSEEAMLAGINAVMHSASGGRMTEAQAEEYAIRSLSALRDVAISRSPAYTIKDAESALMDALDTRTGGTRMLVADILALIDNDLAQRKLFDAALAAKDEEQVELLKRVADSVRIWGDHAEQRQVKALLELVANASGPTAEAAASVHGALNLPTGEAVKLIP